jgi:hypothetical protein
MQIKTFNIFITFDQEVLIYALFYNMAPPVHTFAYLTLC